MASRFKRKDILESFHIKIARKEPIISTGAGAGIVASMAEKAQIDFLIVYNTGLFRLAGAPGPQAFMPYGDANGIALSLLPRIIYRAPNQTMKQGAKTLVRALYDKGAIDGIVLMGGGHGVHMAKTILHALPLGFPKALLSTHYTGAYGGYDKESVWDTMSMKSIVDVAGLNTIMLAQMDNLAAAIVGMVKEFKPRSVVAKPHIAMTMLGITTPCVTRLQEMLERHGYEPVIFHANGDGGYQMEQMIEQGYFAGIADVTLAEIIPQFIPSGAGYSGERRMSAAAERGLPQLIVPGGMDVVNYPHGNHPDQFNDRTFHWHAAELEVMRTNAAENTLFGKTIAERINRGKGRRLVALPLRGVSQNDREGSTFYSAEANKALFSALKEKLDPSVMLLELDCHINDPEFAQTIGTHYLKMLDDAQRA